MISKIKNQKKSVRAFTLIEMVIVLVIIGILLMATLYLSGDQIQKVRDKTVKESILAEIQSRYSRNLGSSSFAGKMYETMDVTFLEGTGHIDFKYNLRDEEDDESAVKNTFIDKFEIKYIANNYNDSDYNPGNINPMEDVILKYYPYQISCKIGDENFDNVVMMIRVNDSRDYCFEIQKKNCRLMEMSESKCEDLKDKAHINN